MTRIETEERILAALRREPQYEISLRLKVGGNRAEVRAALVRLVEAGRIERAESGRFPMYYLSERSGS